MGAGHGKGGEGVAGQENGRARGTNLAVSSSHRIAVAWHVASSSP